MRISSCLAFIFWWRCLPGFGKASTLHITMCKECPLCQKILISLRKECCQKILMVRWNRWRTGSASLVRERGLRWVIIDIYHFLEASLSPTFDKFISRLQLESLCCEMFKNVKNIIVNFPQPSLIMKMLQAGSPAGQGGGSSKYSRLPNTADSPHRL